jgi:hypothetical protein
MDMYANAAATGMGYMLNQERAAKEGFSTPMPSMDNVYHSEHWSAVRRDEEMLANARWEASQAPMDTGMVPRPAYAGVAKPSSTRPCPWRRVDYGP